MACKDLGGGIEQETDTFSLNEKTDEENDLLTVRLRRWDELIDVDAVWDDAERTIVDANLQRSIAQGYCERGYPLAPSEDVTRICRAERQFRHLKDIAALHGDDNGSVQGA